MAVSADFRDFVLEQLAELADVRARRMFGGVGLYQSERFFGILDDDILYLKVDATTRPAYVAAGMGPFRPFARQPEYAMEGYYEVPADVLEDRDLLAAWARLAIAVAAAARAAKPKQPTARGRRAAPTAAPTTRRPRGGGSKPPRGR